MSVNAVVQGGHWAPECLKEAWTYGTQAKYNPFLGQVWWPIHPETDDYSIKMEYSAYDICNELKEKLGLKQKLRRTVREVIHVRAIRVHEAEGAVAKAEE